MFFPDYTTPYEQRTGFVPREALLNRLIAAKAEFFAGDGNGYMGAEVSIAVGDKVYELLLELTPTPIETSPDLLSLVEWTTEGRCLDNGSNSDHEFAVVPLTWSGLVESFCTLFGLDPKLVWDTGVDLKAYWASDLHGAEDVPLPEDAPKFSLRALHGEECPYPMANQPRTES